MKKAEYVPLFQKGRVVSFARVSAEDHPRLLRLDWKLSGHGYAIRNEKTTVLMHREVMGEVPQGFYVDHINQDKLDNRRSNLRICTSAQNSANVSRTRNNTSGYKGVTWNKQRRKWEAKVRNKSFGFFVDTDDAARMYNRVAREKFGEYASLNEVPK